MQSESQFLLELFQEGSTAISNLLLSHYKELGLSDQEMMLIIHLLYFQEKGNLFPAVSELEKRMTLNTEEIMRLLQRLVRQNYIRIDEKKDEITEILSEAYNLTPLYQKFIHWLIYQHQKQQMQTKQHEKEKEVINIFQIFEQEFGRPLSPMEIEMINTWIDQDHYSTELIHYALKEAVFSNKLSFRYIDRILFEWQRKNLKTIDQIKLHIKNFREKQTNYKYNKEKKDYPEFEFYNWLEED
ncbi:DnaD domain protein [Tepidibacillus sp. LV47]|uniref:DnaD domain protein n=1 Tax=Tepidibacillus sp. LV47 TaxID=3398228 RepID=UPI003AAEA3B4